MHRLTALVAAVALLPAFALAPFTHVHLSSTDHQVEAVHSHFSAHASAHATNSTGKSFDDNDEHGPALELDLFKCSAETPLFVADVPTTSSVEPQVQVTSEPVPLAVASLHDPPSTRSPAFRAPPA